VAQIWPDSYGSVKCLHRGAWGEVFSAVRLADKRPVVLKIFGASEEGNEHAKREFNALSSCSHSGIPEAIDLDLSCERPCLVVEQLVGVPLKAWVEANGVPPIEVALELAITWADILSAVHAARLVHRDVTPNNLLVDAASRETHLIDFGITAELGTTAGGRSGEALSSGWAGTLQYIAPEQTGRMNRGCSFQSDLYGFGGTFYFALTGQPPFLYDDPLELIHAHIARQPLAPSAIRSEIPAPLSRLVLKLLAKEPEERYASAASLRCDLIALRDQLQKTGEMDPEFELEAISIPDRPRYSTKLFGREHESETLWANLRHVAKGEPRVVFLLGDAGSGKSALVDGLRARLGELNAYLAQATFDPYIEWPYAGWVGCLESFAAQILVESDTRLREWRERLVGALGPIAGALAELVPDLEAVFGEVPPIAPLGSKETRARLLLALQRFFAAAATEDHPIVVFLDDFQYCDSGSQSLLEELFSSSTASGLMVILACDASKAADTSMLDSVAQRLAALEVPVERIELGSLSSQALLELLEDALGKPRNLVAPLAAHVERKTGCNPLWVRQLIDHLHGQGLIRFEPGQGWQWDLDVIAGASVPDGAIGLLMAKLESLAPEQRDALSWASCAGQTFDVELIARLGERETAHVKGSLLQLEALGLVLPCPDGFRFAHERVREAAKERLSEEERAVLHAEVASWLLETIPEAKRADHAFEMADHLVRASTALPRELGATRIALCLTAGRQALRAGAQIEARRYLDAARRQFSPEDWDARREQGLATWLASAEACFQAGDCQAALELLDEIEPRVVTEIEHARLEMQRILVMALVKAPEVVSQYSLGVLKRLGIRWPLHPSNLRLWITLRRSYAAVLARARLGVKAPGIALDTRRAAIMMVINAAGGPMSRTNARLSALASWFVVTPGLPAHMNAREAFSTLNYALWLQAVFHDTKRAAPLAAAAHGWVKEAGDPVQLARVEMVLRGCMHPMVMARRRAIAGLDLTAERMVENGDVEFAYYTRFLKAIYGTLAGDPVKVSSAQIKALVDHVRRGDHRYPEPARTLHVFRWLSESELDLSSMEEDVAASERWRDEHPGTVEVWEATLWTLIGAIYDRPDLAWRQSERLGKALERCVPYAHVAHHLLYRGIAAASLASSTGGRVYRKALKQAAKRLETWAQMGPDYGHMLQFLRAEQLRLAGKRDQAHRLYEQAARGAMTQEFIHHAALAKERRAVLLLEHRRATEARDVMLQALQLYERWGALLKVTALRAKHASLIGE